MGPAHGLERLLDRAVLLDTRDLPVADQHRVGLGHIDLDPAAVAVQPSGSSSAVCHSAPASYAANAVSKSPRPNASKLARTISTLR